MTGSRAHGSPEQDAKRKALNDFIRPSGVFDAGADFEGDKWANEPARDRAAAA